MPARGVTGKACTSTVQPSRTVLAAIRSAEWRSHVQSALRGDALVFVDDARDFSLAVTRGVPDVALWHLDRLATSIDTYASAFRAFRRAAPFGAIIAYGAVGVAIPHLSFVAGRIGVDCLLLRGVDDLASGVRQTLASGRLETTIRETITRLGVQTGPANVALTHCLRSTRTGPIGVQQLAHGLQVDRKTVSRWLRQAALPAPEQLISWCRVYWVAQLLNGDRCSVAEVARTLRFSSESDLCRMVARHARCTPSRLRENGSDVVIAAFSRASAPGDTRMSHRSTATPQ
jgi:AraC-like DNA-binding protein